MLDETLLDELFPVPDIEVLKAQKVQELRDAGFVITNFQSGGIFNILLMIILNLKIEFTKLLRMLLQQMFISTATGKWLELRAEDFSKTRKTARKTQGDITVYALPEHQTVTIPKASVFKTRKDINGNELKFFSLEDVVLPDTASSVSVPIEAEKTGSDYNVPAGQIILTLTHLPGVERVMNEGTWITREGSDMEGLESLRERTLNSWAELSMGTTAQKYRNVCEAVNGVLYVRVDDMHPRGQGTVDIIVTSTAGEASRNLLEDVEKAAESVKGEYDNLLVKSADVVTQDIGIHVTMPKLSSAEGIGDRVEAVIVNYFKISTERSLNEIILIDLLFSIKNALPGIKNARMTQPETDIRLDSDKVILLGNITVTVTNEE